MLIGGRNQTTLNANVDDSCARSVRTAGIPADLTDFAQVQALVERILEAFGRIDIMTHCASGRGAASIIDTPRSDGSGIARRMRRAQEAPPRRLGSGADIANACAYLVSEQAGFITGQTISVDGGSYM